MSVCVRVLQFNTNALSFIYAGLAVKCFTGVVCNGTEILADKEVTPFMCCAETDEGYSYTTDEGVCSPCIGTVERDNF